MATSSESFERDLSQGEAVMRKASTFRARLATGLMLAGLAAMKVWVVVSYLLR